MRPTVILRRCPTYAPDRIRGIVREAVQALGDAPRGRVLVKPNGVIANRKVFPHAFTRPEFLDGVLGAVRDTASELEELAVGERCGITMPTRMVFREAGWNPVVARHRARAYYFEEEPQVEVALTRPPRLREHVYAPEPIVRCDYLVNCPKFKAHPWTTLTLVLKNLIGLQHDPHRLIDHDHRLDEKIADLQEIVAPRFIAIDAITAGQDRMLTPVPFELGLVIMGNNPVAIDAIGALIAGLDPKAIGHIRLAHEKGFGPIDRGEIALDGDVTLEQARAAANGFRVGAGPGRAVLPRHPHHRARGTAAGGGPRELLLGWLPGGDRGGDRDRSPDRPERRRDDAPRHGGVRRIPGADRARARREGPLHR
jgi:uncharacterized protein (DUF362 family)